MEVSPLKAILLIMPFLAILFWAFGISLSAAFPEYSWLATLGTGIGGVLFIVWIILDLERIRFLLSRKGFRYGSATGINLILMILVVIGVAILSNRPRFNKVFDLTRNEQFTLSDQTVKILTELKAQQKKLFIKGYFRNPEVEKSFDLLVKKYIAVNNEIEKKYFDPDTNVVQAKKDSISSSNEVILSLDNRVAKLLIFTEEKLTSAILQLLKAKEKKIYFLSGHGEPSIKNNESLGLSRFYTELSAYSYKAQSLVLDKEVPSDAQAVIICGPELNISIQDKKALYEYLQRGGNLYVMLDAIRPADNINQLIEPFGIRFNNDFLVLEQDNPVARIAGQNNALIELFDPIHPVTRDFSQHKEFVIKAPDTRSISLTDGLAGTKNQILAKTGEKNIGILDVYTIEDLKEVDAKRILRSEFGFLAFAQSNGDNNKESRLIAIGTSSIARNQFFSEGLNRDLLLNALNYLLKDEEVLAIRPKEKFSGTLVLTQASQVYILAILCFLYPFLYLGYGTFIWYRRKNR